MSAHEHHGRHGHHEHHQHGSTTAHQPSPDASEAYRKALAVQPDPGRSVISALLEPCEFDWTLDRERRVRGWGYGGAVPGPVITGQVGDVLEVRLVNRLPEPTNVHWHGLRVPAAMDGTESTQWPVPPGGEFVYRFRLPDAGTFWYHPHVNETVQLEKGLYGALVVRGEDEPVLDEERVLVLDDLRLDKRGGIATFGGMIEHHDGREGGVRLVNGVPEPVLHVSAGQIERWRVVNASSARYVRLSIGGAPYRILGTDGGLIEAPFAVREALLAPGDRLDLAVGPFSEGQELAVEALPYFRRTVRRRGLERFATVKVGPRQPSRAVVPERLRTIAPLAPPSAEPNRVVKLGVKASLRKGIQFVVDGEAHHHAGPVKAGELQVWDIVNTTQMDHPFHLHGFFFQVLSVNGEPPAFRSWEDVVNLGPRARVRIAWLPDERPGSWMYHCHILEHHAGGMMAHFDVVV